MPNMNEFHPQSQPKLSDHRGPKSIFLRPETARRGLKFSLRVLKSTSSGLATTPWVHNSTPTHLKLTPRGISQLLEPKFSFQWPKFNFQRLEIDSQSPNIDSHSSKNRPKMPIIDSQMQKTTLRSQNWLSAAKNRFLEPPPINFSADAPEICPFFLSVMEKQMKKSHNLKKIEKCNTT